MSANGSTAEIPLYDPIVAAHFGNPNSMAETLMSEIFLKEIYAPLFFGKQDLTFLDIGANIGLVSLYAYDACARIVAVEPSEVFKVLEAMTFPLTKIERVRLALAPKDGPCEFFSNDENTTASSTVNTFGTKSSVMGMTLSSLLSVHQLEHVDVCKVDCEGAEELSLNASELQFASKVVDTFWIETHNTPGMRWADTLTRLSATLDYLGYTKQEIDGMRLLASK
jgi:FkbM family methyltransferase